MSYQIKELGVGGILDQALKVTKENLGVLLPITFYLIVPLQIALGLIQVSAAPDLPPDATLQEIGAAQQASAPLLIVSGIGGILIGLVAQPITQAALIFAIAELYLGNRPSVGQSFSRGTSRFVPLLGTNILYGLAVMGGMILLIVPGIIFALWFWLYQHVVVIEEESGSKALGRSRALMKSNMNKVVAVGMVVFVMLIGVQLIPQFIPQPHVAVILAGLVQGVALVVSTAVSVVFYFSCLCQHENFDLKRLAAAVGEAEEPATPEPGLGL